MTRLLATLVFWIVAGHAVLCTLYLAILCLAALRYRAVSVPKSPPEPTPRLAVVIPAHNEASGIAATVRSAAAAHWPPQRLDIHVVADNCDDDTAGAAQAAGATVHSRRAPDNRGKGQALDWFFRQCAPAYAAADIVVVIDADTLMLPDFAPAMAAAFARPDVLAAQGYYGVRNPQESWRTSLIAAALALFHHLRPAGRDVLGASAGLRGNGMAFRADLLRRLGWPAHGIVEDAECALVLLGEDIRVRYVASAVVLAEMAATAQQADSQRRRWEAGRLALLRSHGPGLFRGLSRQNALARLDAALDLLTPPLTLLALEQCLAAAAAAVLAPGWFPALLGLPLVTVAAVVLALALRREPAFVWLRLAAAPAFAAWKLLLYARMLFSKKTTAWTRTLRRGERPEDAP